MGWEGWDGGWDWIGEGVDQIDQLIELKKAKKCSTLMIDIDMNFASLQFSSIRYIHNIHTCISSHPIPSKHPLFLPNLLRHDITPLMLLITVLARLDPILHTLGDLARLLIRLQATPDQLALPADVPHGAHDGRRPGPEGLQ